MSWSKTFKDWAVPFFSWEETVDPHELESHEMAWDAGYKAGYESAKAAINNLDKVDREIVEYTIKAGTKHNE
jgi:lipase chaperone LimK